MIGGTLGHYKIVDKLGEGGMGEVYEAEDTELRRRVALKVLPADMAADPERLERFQREARMVAALNHPNIVTIFSVEKTTIEVPRAQDPKTSGPQESATSSESVPVHFLTMELVDGQTLGSLIPGKGMGLDELFNVAIPLADALVSAHDAGITHRDLKPGNVMVTGDRRVKVLDFGLAKVHDQAPEVDATHLATEAITEDGRVLGTVPYMSPEQVEGKALDPRSDIFSMGILLYEMATGRRPFEGDSSAALMSAILRESPNSVTVLKEDLPRQLARIIAHCLEKDPDRRFQTAKDLRNELQSLSREIETGEILESSTTAVSAIQPVKKRSRLPMLVGAGLGLIAVLVLGFLLLRQDGDGVPGSETTKTPPSSEQDGRTMVAVLPFENLGAADDEYFADGLTEEITSRLAAVSGLGVISRTSAMQYKENRPSLKQIGQELGVDYVLEGTVRWERPSEGPSRIRVTPQLIRVADDTHLWSERYDRELEQLFEVQSSIAGEVTSALNVTLLEPEQAAIDEQPTENMEAYQAYLRGLELWFRTGFDWDVFERAGVMFERAVELDPVFLLAYTELVGVYGMLYSWRDRTEDRLADLERVMSRAEALDPAHPQVRLAKGFYYYFGFWEYEKALEEFLAAEAMLPNIAEVPEAKAYVLRRLGRMEEAAEALARAFELDPRNAHFSSELGRTLTAMRRHAEAVQYHERAIQLAPDSRHVYYLTAFNLLAWQGDVSGATAIVDQAPGDATEDRPFDWELLAHLTGEYEAALDRLGVLAAAADAEGDLAPWVRNHQGSFNELLGNDEVARGFYERAAAEARQALEEAPRLAHGHSALSFAAAGLGQRELALSENQAAYDLVEQDRFWSPAFLEDRARIHTRFDELDSAVDLLDELLATPYDYSITVALLRLESDWRPLQDHPRFQALLDRYESDGD